MCAQKKPHGCVALKKTNRRLPTFAYYYTIIGPCNLNRRVRNGIGCLSQGMTAAIINSNLEATSFRPLVWVS